MELLSSFAVVAGAITVSAFVNARAEQIVVALGDRWQSSPKVGERLVVDENLSKGSVYPSDAERR